MIFGFLFAMVFAFPANAQVIQIIGGACSVTPTSANVGDIVTWSATGAGGVKPYSYTWSGSDNLYGTGSTIAFKYATPGIKYMNVSIRSDDGQITFRNCSVQIGNNYSIATSNGNYYNTSALYPQYNYNTASVYNSVYPYFGTNYYQTTTVQGGSVSSLPATVALSQVPYTGLVYDLLDSTNGILFTLILLAMTGATAYSIKKILA